jgi:hypothetical protein
LYRNVLFRFPLRWRGRTLLLLLLLLLLIFILLATERVTTAASIHTDRVQFSFRSRGMKVKSDINMRRKTITVMGEGQVVRAAGIYAVQSR